jgi:hypothetical protein
MTRRTVTAIVLGLGLIWSSGCGGKKDAPNNGKPADDDHDHGPGPHGGVIIEFGKYHAEFKPDHAKKEATVWLLKGDAKTPARLKVDKLHLVVTNMDPKIDIELLPTDAADDGTASVFVGRHDGFGVEKEFQGTVSGKIDGKPHTGDFKEEPEKKK